VRQSEATIADLQAQLIDALAQQSRQIAAVDTVSRDASALRERLALLELADAECVVCWIARGA
jgi:hypothetical protein